MRRGVSELLTKNSLATKLTPVARSMHDIGYPHATAMLYVRRPVAEGRESPPLLGRGLEELAAEFERRSRQAAASSAAGRLRLRDGIIRDAGGLSYDRIAGEFGRVARAIRWPKSATLKGFRHLFATTVANGGLAEHERRYLMGHAPGRDAIHVYTHLNELADHYRAVAEDLWSGVLEVIRTRIAGRQPAGPASQPV